MKIRMMCIVPGLALVFIGGCSPFGIKQNSSIPKPATPRVEIAVFQDDLIQYSPGDSVHADSMDVGIADKGREIFRTITLPQFDKPVRIMATVRIKPIPKDDISVYDPWDRAGNFRIKVPGQPDVELVKFVTAYGGFTEFNVDVSQLAPLLQGGVTLVGSIDTWVKPAWWVDLTLTFQPDIAIQQPIWVLPLMYEPSFSQGKFSDDQLITEIEIPAGAKKIALNYLVSGHCTDGRDADEFVSKDNVIGLDGTEIYRFKPWRDDCQQYRAINPYTRRWSDGWWSSDFSRTGWCPGTAILPTEIPVAIKSLSAGKHKVSFGIENIRPKDETGYGYWRVSAYLVGYEKQ